MARKKKYEEVTDLSKFDEGLQFLEELRLDSLGVFPNRKKLCSSVYSITTSGGKGKVWKVNEKDRVLFTVSSESVDRVKVNAYISVPKYLHYVLTDEGIKAIKLLVVEHSI